MTKLYSPSTYAGAAARSLTGNGTFGSNLTSGTGFNDPITNIAFDVATPFALKSLHNPIPRLFNSYETLNNTGREALNSVLQWQAKHPIFNRTILPPNQAGHFYRVGSSPMIDDAVNTGLIQSRTGWYHGSLDKAINDHPQLLKYFTRDELDNMRPFDLMMLWKTQVQIGIRLENQKIQIVYQVTYYIAILLIMEALLVL